jgi:hypothetical protein
LSRKLIFRDKMELVGGGGGVLMMVMVDEREAEMKERVQ